MSTKFNLYSSIGEICPQNQANRVDLINSNNSYTSSNTHKSKIPHKVYKPNSSYNTFNNSNVLLPLSTKYIPLSKRGLVTPKVFTTSFPKGFSKCSSKPSTKYLISNYPKNFKNSINKNDLHKCLLKALSKGLPLASNIHKELLKVYTKEKTEKEVNKKLNKVFLQINKIMLSSNKDECNKFSSWCLPVKSDASKSLLNPESDWNPEYSYHRGLLKFEKRFSTRPNKRNSSIITKTSKSKMLDKKLFDYEHKKRKNNNFRMDDHYRNNLNKEGKNAIFKNTKFFNTTFLNKSNNNQKIFSEQFSKISNKSLMDNRGNLTEIIDIEKEYLNEEDIIKKDGSLKKTIEQMQMGLIDRNDRSKEYISSVIKIRNQNLENYQYKLKIRDLRKSVDTISHFNIPREYISSNKYLARPQTTNVNGQKLFTEIENYMNKNYKRDKMPRNSQKCHNTSNYENTKKSLGFQEIYDKLIKSRK